MIERKFTASSTPFDFHRLHLDLLNDLNKKNRVFGNICLSGKVEMIDFNPTPFIILSSQQGCVKASFFCFLLNPLFKT